ncbi:MAG: hypothetical protein IJ555_11635 [Ruminococcus sp.]|nr:hypothetical protein [Ruminococcus sp.]
MGHSVNGRNLCGLIGGYMIIKSILNLILSFGFANILMLAISAGLCFGLIISFKYMNYITAAFLIIMVLVNIKGNISNFGLNVHLVYLAEAVIDVICAWQLITNEDIKEFFNHS